MRRVLVASFWFLVLAFASLLLVRLGAALYVLVRAPTHSSQQAIIQFGTDFVQAHVDLIRGLNLAALLAAALMAGVGAYRGVLPGSRRS